MKNYWISILSSISLSFVLASGNAQNVKNQYLFPIKPGQQNFLAGSMGEIRGTHFHAGIDIKVGGVTGWPVYAIADGYVSRVKVSTGGYGNALYLTHADGNTSLYGHLLRYENQLQAYVRQNQYRTESFEIELTPNKDQIRFKKGDIIGYAGNSGSSQGPHLHFEIRDSRQFVLDPLKFGFTEVKDDLPPIVSKIALTTMGMDSRINGAWGTFILEPELIDGVYVIKNPIDITGTVGVAVYAYDRMNGVPNRNGVPCVEMSLDSTLIFSQNINAMNFNEMRNVVVHIDYPLLLATGDRYNKLYVDHGNTLHFLKNQPGPGLITVNDTLSHEVSIKLMDSHENVRWVKMAIGKSANPRPIKKVNTGRKGEEFAIQKNIMELSATPKDGGGQHIKVFANRLTYDVSPAFLYESKAYFLWDMAIGLPDSVDLCGKMVYPQFMETISPASTFNYFHKDFTFSTNDNDLFDTIHLRFEKQLIGGREVFEFKNESTPLRSNANVVLKPSEKYIKEKTHVYTYGAKGQLGYVGGKWSGNNMSFATRELGAFTLAADTIPPEIKIAKVTPDEIRLTISDQLSGIKDFRVTVDGKWVLMNYDYKQKLLWSEKLEPNKPFAGELLIKVTDNAHNEKVYKSKI